MSPVEHAVICAAGIGSRLGLNRPKCLIEIAGRSLLDYHLERLKWAKTIWLVVGFQEEEVAAHALSLRPDIIVVRNPDFANTNTLQSLHRVSRHLNERMLFLDGDTIVENESFSGFLDATKAQQSLIGVSAYTTSDGVRASVVDGEVVGFTRTTDIPLEWTGIAVVNPQVVTDEPIYVYQALERFLPLPAYELKAFDIDTVDDLDMARRALSSNWAFDAIN